MANEQDNLSVDNFSIQDTMQMGMGNPSLLEGLLDSGAASANPDTLEAIVKTVEDKPVTEKTPPKGKEITPLLPGEVATGDDIMSNFLGSDDDDDDTIVNDNKSKVSDIVKKNNLADDNDDADNNTDIDSDDSKFGALSNDLKKLGVFSEDEEGDEGIKTPEQFLERFQSEKKKGAIEMVNNFIGQFGEDYQEAFDAIFVKGVKPQEYFGTYNNIVNYSDMDLTNEVNQEKVVREGLASQGFDAEDIETEIERYKNYGDLETVANKHSKVLIKKESLKLQDLEAKSEQALQEKTAVRNQYINNVQNVLQDKLKTKEFDGIPLNPKLAGELQDFLLIDKYKTASGETLTDFDKTILELKRPENHANKVKIALLLKILEKDPTLSTIQKTGVTKQTNTMFDSVVRQSTKEAVKSASVKKNAPDKWFT
jgi:hypothetical protein